MTHLSRSKLPKHTEIQMMTFMLEALTRIGNTKEMALLLKVLLTETEKRMLAKRLMAVYLIYEGKKDVEISGALNLTRATIQKIRLIYTYQGEDYKAFLKAVNRHVGKETIKTIIKEIVMYPLTHPRISSYYPKYNE